MSIPTADPAPAAKPMIYLDVMSKRDIDFDSLEFSMTSDELRDSVWGFVIYRCSDGDQSAWEHMLHDIRSEVQECLRFYVREDLLPLHDLHVIDDPALYGATSHEVRDHFHSWVAEDIKFRLPPKVTELATEDAMWMNPRYLYCLFADDICLESMRYPGTNSPVVKILDKSWGPLSPEKRNYKVAAPFHDGVTEEIEEDVGWMYLPLDYYMWKYEGLARNDWYTTYMRPPYIDGDEEESELIGYWM
ncbi:hypothetical protein E4U42_004669 [Claviceps africana]|uniref:Uncharacterized protein n=1 Tax=Claviceps africana TaxID=83212 RepID=A0A8K0JBW4_9HYPO|nr:hypothetical protein E4U42_004669 [Claviceps africana]